MGDSILWGSVANRIFPDSLSINFPNNDSSASNSSNSRSHDQLSSNGPLVDSAPWREISITRGDRISVFQTSWIGGTFMELTPKWRTIIDDEDNNSRCRLLRDAFTSYSLAAVVANLDEYTQWQDLGNRHAIWYTRYNCRYRYGKRINAMPNPFLQWLEELTDTITTLCDLPQRPNACNVNFYADNTQGLDFMQTMRLYTLLIRS